MIAPGIGLPTGEPTEDRDEQEITEQCDQVVLGVPPERGGTILA